MIIDVLLMLPDVDNRIRPANEKHLHWQASNIKALKISMAGWHVFSFTTKSITMIERVYNKNNNQNKYFTPTS